MTPIRGSEAMETLRDIPGLLLLRNPSNLGFLLSCNAAARVARGRYLHMLNNDTEVRPGTIDALGGAARCPARISAWPDRNCLFPDGRLQEAGGILWTDATGWNYGRGENPDRPDFNYLRDVDYCSGASIMVRRSLFEQLGGFDEGFAPAYYEDADLAFRIRAQGQRVVYEPRSVVVHHEGRLARNGHGVRGEGPISASIKRACWSSGARRWRGTTMTVASMSSARATMRGTARSFSSSITTPWSRTAMPGSRSTMGIIDSLIDAGWVV